MHPKFRTFAAAATVGLGLFLAGAASHIYENDKTTTMENDIKLGAFSVSLSVKDLTVSKKFYENLGFQQFAGSMEQNYLIMKNDKAIIGLFQGMFEGNI